jgi:hypothetical protein
MVFSFHSSLFEVICCLIGLGLRLGFGLELGSKISPLFWISPLFLNFYYSSLLFRKRSVENLYQGRMGSLFSSLIIFSCVAFSCLSLVLSCVAFSCLSLVFLMPFSCLVLSCLALPCLVLFCLPCLALLSCLVLCCLV